MESRLKKVAHYAFWSHIKGEKIKKNRTLESTSDRGAMRRTGVFVLVVAMLVSVPGWSQTTTGRLLGRAVDESGAALPGVSVTISSPALIGGAQVKTTDDKGEAVFLSLGPGDYTVKTELGGFIPQERSRVNVPLGGAAIIIIAMPMGTFSGEIEVVDETPLVDMFQVNTGQTFRADYLQKSALGMFNRTYNTVVIQAAGVRQGGMWSGVPQPSVLGSTLGDNAFFIDGMDATNPVTGAATAVLNFDAIEEIQLQTAGFEAEYGRATGGIINVVSKSGGNQFSGTLDIRYTDERFQESGDHFDAGELAPYTNLIAGATLGGPIVRDKVWFFASYGWIDRTLTPDPDWPTATHEGQNYLGKITWQIAPAWRLGGKFTSDPTAWDCFYLNERPEACGNKKGTTAIASTELTSVLSDKLLWYATLGRYTYESQIFPLTGELAPIAHYNYDTGDSTVNHWEQQYWDTTNTDFTTDLTWFVPDLAGSHEFKGGLEYSDRHFSRAACFTGTPNGERCVAGGVGFRFFDITDEPDDAEDDEDYEYTALPFYMREQHTAGPQDYTGDISTVFAEDAWRPARDLTLKIGLRYDTITYNTSTGSRMVEFNMLQPRLGLSWDIAGNAKNILRGSWGRFLHPNLMSLPGLVTDAPEPFYYWYSCTTIMEASSAEECTAIAADLGWDWRTDNVGWDPNGWALDPRNRFASDSPLQWDRNLRTTYADELVLAFEREVGRRSAIELTFIDKKTRDIVQSTCSGNWPTPSAEAACDYFILANVPELKRDYRGLMLRFETRSLPWLTLNTSYTYASDKGSIGYSQGHHWTVDLYPWHYENIYGYMAPKHYFKLNGFFSIKGDWTITFDGGWVSGDPWSITEDGGDNEEILWGQHFIEPRGSRWGLDFYSLDLALTKGFRIGSVRLVGIVTAFNALGSDQVTEICDGPWCDREERGMPLNWEDPRRWEVGFRVEF